MGRSRKPRTRTRTPSPPDPTAGPLRDESDPTPARERSATTGSDDEIGRVEKILDAIVAFPLTALALLFCQRRTAAALFDPDEQPLQIRAVGFLAVTTYCLAVLIQLSSPFYLLAAWVPDLMQQRLDSSIEVDKLFSIETLLLKTLPALLMLDVQARALTYLVLRQRPAARGFLSAIRYAVGIQNLILLAATAAVAFYYQVDLQVRALPWLPRALDGAFEMLCLYGPLLLAVAIPLRFLLLTTGAMRDQGPEPRTPRMVLACLWVVVSAPFLVSLLAYGNETARRGVGISDEVRFVRMSVCEPRGDDRQDLAITLAFRGGSNDVVLSSASSQISIGAGDFPKTFQGGSVRDTFSFTSDRGDDLAYVVLPARKLSILRGRLRARRDDLVGPDPLPVTFSPRSLGAIVPTPLESSLEMVACRAAGDPPSSR